MVDADGPGQLLGFVYGVRLLDDVDRWSHGGAENIYIRRRGGGAGLSARHRRRGLVRRGLRGRAASAGDAPLCGDALLCARGRGRGPPGAAAGRLPLSSRRTVCRSGNRCRCGSAAWANDICSTVYWYQEGAVRPFFRMPDWPQLLPGVELPRGVHDLPLPPERRMVAVRAVREPRRPGDGERRWPPETRVCDGHELRRDCTRRNRPG